MSGRLRRGIVACALVLGAAAQAHAQDTPAAQPSHGGWLGAGFGYGAFRTDCANCERDDLYSSGGGVIAAAGMRVNDRVDAGAEIFWAATTFESGEYRSAFLMGIAQFRPWQSHGFYIKGGLGLAFVRATITVGGQSVESTPKGLGVHYGAGWVFRRDRRVSFGPFGAHYVASLGDLPTAAGVAENPVSNVWFAGATVFFR